MLAICDSAFIPKLVENHTFLPQTLLMLPSPPKPLLLCGKNTKRAFVVEDFVKIWGVYTNRIKENKHPKNNQAMFFE